MNANKELQETISLDVIIDEILDKMDEHMPPFIRECEKDIMVKMQDYTKKAVCQNTKDVMQITEAHAGELLDSVCRANHEYFAMGMRAGSNLLLQLLGI